MVIPDNFFNIIFLALSGVGVILLAFNEVSSREIEIDPPGAIAGQEYTGMLTTSPPIDFKDADSIIIQPFSGGTLAGIDIIEKENGLLTFKCVVDSSFRHSLGIGVSVHQNSKIKRLRFYLNVVGPEWNPEWKPVAVAPDDTTVTSDAGDIILDLTGSHHPGGFGAMHFRWIIDGEQIIKGGPVTSITLPEGKHTIELIAEDHFGKVDTDTMTVNVIPKMNH